ncbi:MAG: transglutaminase domain-containing protein [Fimbriimonadia bacterium]
MRSTLSRLPDYLATWVFMAAAIVALHAALEAPGEGLRVAGLLGVGCLVSLVLRLAGSAAGVLFLGPYVCGVLGAIGWIAPYPIGAEMSDFAAVHLAVGARVVWLLVLRSFVMVTDGDMLFQAVPSMALLGIAATYSDAAWLPLLFLVFLAGAVFALSRSHIRAIGAGRVHRSVAAGPVYALTGAAVVAGVAFVLAPLVGLGVEKLVPARVFIGPGPRQAVTLPTAGDAAELEIGVGGHSSTDLQVLRVRADRPLYLRERAFHDYNGMGWRSGVIGPQTVFPSTPGVFDLNLGFRLDDTLAREEVSYEVEVTRGSHQMLYLAGEPTEVEIDSPVLFFAFRDFVRPNRDMLAGERYRAHSAVPLHRRLGNAGAERRRFALRYMQLPETRSPELRALATRVTARARNDYQRVQMLRDYISRTCGYTLQDAPLNSRTDRVSEFLFERKKGYCDSFASALAVLCRELRLPARVVRGYAPGDFDRNSGTYVIREKHLHLWTEVLFEGVGWVIFDATEGARNLDEEAGPAAALAADQEFWRSPWWSLVLDVAIGLIAAYILLSLWIARLRATRVQDARSAVGRQYARFLRSLRRVGLPSREPHLTPIEHLRFIEPHLPPSLAPLAAAVVEGVDAGLFGRGGPESVLPDLRLRVEEWLRQIRSLPKGRI